MRADNTTTSSAQPKNPEFQTSADLQISPNTESGLFLSPKTSPKLGADVPKLPLFSVLFSSKKTTQPAIHPASPVPSSSQASPVDVPGAGRKEDRTKKANPRDPMAPGITVARHALLQEHRGDFGAPHVSYAKHGEFFYGERMGNLRWEKG